MKTLGLTGLILCMLGAGYSVLALPFGIESGEAIMKWLMAACVSAVVLVGGLR